jgi:DNA adenine methylase
VPRPLAAFNWFGGKTAMVSHIVPVLMRALHKTYVESFGGSGAVLLNKGPSPVEVYNDAYGDVVHFFKMLRERRDELIGAIELTPYSREEFALGCDRAGAEGVERARRFFVVARQVLMGLATTATPGRWCTAPKHSRRGMALVVSRWLSSVEALDRVAARFREVIVEHLDGLEVIRRYDGPDTLHYVDPPYPMVARSGGKGYKHEFVDEAGRERHDELLEILLAAQGKVALSSYPNELYDRRLGGAGWHLTMFKSQTQTAKFHKGAALDRAECLWTNWRPEAVTVPAEEGVDSTPEGELGLAC